ncbi:hypothetical protein [Tautonia plasticadhaerens]|uniref:Uncharacterized protein n=1 Tax=Tautonia plasticadhaerens TaxID=2527974 RepID=A0A518H939_9BACT|nr:hypothetical protein [Tautonia plasticadhaerens]QDV37368.1 hypothetical protein ElP_53060 [Tautonia plasticadhaerens]
MDPNTPLPPTSAERLDLLVEGALPDLERRALLLALDAEPGGWRRCALAFLEAQSWRTAIGSLAEPFPAGRSPGEPAVLLRPRLPLVPVAVAAAIAVAAFLVGRSTGPVPRSAPPSGPIAPTLAGDPEHLGPQPPPSSDSTEHRSAMAGRGEPPDPPASPNAAPAYQAIGLLNLASDDDPDVPVVQVPVLSGPGIDDRWLRDQPSFVPEEVRRSWELSGFDVELQRRLVSVQLDEAGRYLTIPVDEVLLRQPTRLTY